MIKARLEYTSNTVTPYNGIVIPVFLRFGHGWVVEEPYSHAAKNL